MTRRVTCKRRAAVGGCPLGRSVVASSHGFTVVEMTTSVAVLVIVMSAAWLLLTTSNDNLNRISYGGQASELNRAALASFERDLGHAMLPYSRTSAVLVAQKRTCSFMADVDNPADGYPELVTWSADDEDHSLVRTVKRPPQPLTADEITGISDFGGGTVTSTTVLTGLASDTDIDTPMFTYKAGATDAASDMADHPGRVGLVTFRLANGLPDKSQNLVDRTGAFRVIAFVINGY